MPVDVFLPTLGDMEEGTLLEWLTPAGARVETGQPIAVVDADKVTVDVHAPGTGYLTILLEAGERAVVQQLIARIDPEPPQ